MNKINKTSVKGILSTTSKLFSPQTSDFDKLVNNITNKKTKTLLKFLKKCFLNLIKNDKIEIKRAIVSVHDKSYLSLLADYFIKYKIEVLSTGGTARFLKNYSTKLKIIEIQNLQILEKF